MDRRAQIIGWLKEILHENLHDISFRAFIFGSQANRNLLIRSDIDLGLISENKITSQQLANINAAIEELPMLYKIDVVDFNEVDERFKSAALKNIEDI